MTSEEDKCILSTAFQDSSEHHKDEVLVAGVVVADQQRVRRRWVSSALVLAFFLALSGSAVVLLRASSTIPDNPEEQQVPELVYLLQPLEDVSSDELLDLTGFGYTLTPQIDVCSGQDDIEDDEGGNDVVLILIHSAPEHFEQRRAIRDTWGSVRRSSGWEVRTIFLLGQVSPSRGYRRVSAALVAEAATHADLLQGRFVDSYRNLTYKHVMGYEWSWRNCARSILVLKADDDAFVDVHRLLAYTRRAHGGRPRGLLACDVLPEGTPPRRDGKWGVTHEEYPSASYPRYCGGLAYLVSADLVRDLRRAAQKVPFFWIDDVYTTGVLAGALRLPHFYMNLHYSYDARDYLSWLRDPDARHPLPHMVSHVDTSLPDWPYAVRQLWQKTMRLSPAS